MKTVFSPLHAGHAGQMELMPARSCRVSRSRRGRRSSGRASKAREARPDPRSRRARPCRRQARAQGRLHRLPADCVAAMGGGRQVEGSAHGLHLADTRAARRRRRRRRIDALLGYYSFDAGATFVEGTWAAIKSSYDVALTAAGPGQGRRARGLRALPAARPSRRCCLHGWLLLHQQRRRRRAMVPRPGRRHASRILDVDYHHGNGTQEIFYDRGDVHGRQSAWRPDDRVSVLPRPCRRARRGRWRRLQPQLSHAVRHRLGRTGALRWRTPARKLAAYAPDVVVVSLGVDTFEKDPISQFKLKSDDYPKIGRRIARLGLPTLFVMEGGYAVEEIGINAVGVLTGFEDR